MKTLVLVRHAKSSWAEPGLVDHDRPLNDRGLRDAPEMGRRLRERGFRPDVVLSSTAVRARTTAELIAEALALAPDVITTERNLYGSTPDTMLAVVTELDALREPVESVMVVAHDPGMSELAHILSAGDIERMPTCAVAEFRFDVDEWGVIRSAQPTDVRFDSPRA